MIDHTHDPAARSWLSSANGHADFPVQNLPLGVFSPSEDMSPRGGVAIGESIVDLVGLAPALSRPIAQLAATTAQGQLNSLVDAGAAALRQLRHELFALLTDPAQQDRVFPHLHSAASCLLHVPFAIGDYTDFYTGIHHAENIGRIFRPDNPLLPNYKHVPIGYHGRASSIRLSGVDVVRPHGQTRPAGQEVPTFGPCRRLDYELELGIWVGQGNTLGQPVPIAEAAQRIAGLCLLNDWSARDIQAWEYQPLGPFLAKNFQSTISPWVVTIDALAPFRRAQPSRPEGDPAPLPYLCDAADQAAGAFDITLEVTLSTRQMRAAGLAPLRLSRGSTLAMYWTCAQLVTHHASNGCNLVPGDLLGSGTLSGAEETSFGSLMELSRNGARPIALPSGETRSFLEDGDEISMTAFAEAAGYARIGFGECRARIVG